MKSPAGVHNYLGDGALGRGSRSLGDSDGLRVFLRASSWLEVDFQVPCSYSMPTVGNAEV